jgi:hypothetical protein
MDPGILFEEGWKDPRNILDKNYFETEPCPFIMHSVTRASLNGLMKSSLSTLKGITSDFCPMG